MTDSAGTAATQPGIIAISGTDAAEFLRAQLTNDVRRLGTDRHFLAAWCDAKGRALMICRVARITHGFLLILPHALVGPMLQRLRMYVLRAKVDLHDASGDYFVGGHFGEDLPPPGRTENRNGLWQLGLPSGTDRPGRALLIAERGRRPSEDIVAPDTAAWQLASIDAGLPALQPATQGQFLPQMLNLHWLMAVDFDKGCYPGQEVIARLHYRGRLTRRLFRLAWSGTTPTAGDTITDTVGENVGTVVRGATENRGYGRLLAVLKVDAAQRPLRYGGADELILLDLPYATPN